MSSLLPFCTRCTGSALRLDRVILSRPQTRPRAEDETVELPGLRLVDLRHEVPVAIEGLAPGTLATMMAHQWPGNVRALAKVLKEAMILREVGWVQQDDLRIASGPRLGRPTAEAAEGPAHPAPVAGAPLSADKRRETVLRMAQEQGAVNRRQLAAQCGVSGETARVELRMLTRLGLLRPVGKGSATRYVRA